MTLRKTTSLTTLVSFVLLLTSSIVLYATPQGKVAFWADWRLLGLDKDGWGALHTNLGFLFIVAGIVHIALNWKPVFAYLKDRTKRLKVFTADFTLALAITLFIVFATLFAWPPVHGIQTFGESLKAAASSKYGEPPYGHAETSPLRLFCQRTGIDLDPALEKLRAKGIKGVDAGATLAEIAAANRTAPQRIYEIFKPSPAEIAAAGMPESPGAGFGRKRLADVCKEYGLDLDIVSAGLASQNIKVSGDPTIKEIADESGIDPHALYEAVRQTVSRP